MSLRPQLIAQVPGETVRVARAAFPQGTMYIHLRDELGVLFTDTDFARLFPTRGRPAEAPWRLAMVTIMQYVEGLSDRAAADAVRSRIDWKYATLARVDRPRLRAAPCYVSCGARLIDGNAEHLVLDKLLAVCRERKWTQGARAATNRLDACVDGGTCPQSFAVRRRDATARPQQLGSDRARVVAAAQPLRVGGTPAPSAPWTIR